MKLLCCLLHAVTLVPAFAAAPPKAPAKEAAVAMDLEAAWKKNEAGFRDLLAHAAKSDKNKEQVIKFLQAKLAAQWKLSTVNNGRHPIRETLQNLVAWSEAVGADASRGKQLIHEAMTRLDRAEDDAVPDFLYTWLKPTGE